MFNPFGLLFWSGIFASNISNLDSFWINTCIIIGVLLWGAFLSLVLAFGKRIFKKSFINIITKISGILMIIYSIKYTYSALII